MQANVAFFLDKKRIQVATLIDYMESRITANDALRTFNLERAKGKWAGAKLGHAVDEK